MKLLDTSMPITWWLTGLPGAGKTTLAQALGRALRTQGMTVCVLDGDELRRGPCADLGYSPEDRETNIQRVAEIAALLNRNHIDVIVALISPTHIGRNQARRIIGAEVFIEVYVSTPIDVCQQRDPKGLYAKAKQQPDFPFTGVNALYEPPQCPNIEVDTSTTNIEAAVARMINEASHIKVELGSSNV